MLPVQLFGWQLFTVLLGSLLNTSPAVVNITKTGLNSTVVTILLCNSRSFLLRDSYLGITVLSVCTNYCHCSEEVLLASCLCFHG